MTQITAFNQHGSTITAWEVKDFSGDYLLQQCRAIPAIVGLSFGGFGIATRTSTEPLKGNEGATFMVLDRPSMSFVGVTADELADLVLHDKRPEGL